MWKHWPMDLYSLYQCFAIRVKFYYRNKKSWKYIIFALSLLQTINWNWTLIIQQESSEFLQKEINFRDLPKNSFRILRISKAIHTSTIYYAMAIVMRFKNGLCTNFCDSCSLYRKESQSRNKSQVWMKHKGLFTPRKSWKKCENYQRKDYKHPAKFSPVSFARCEGVVMST